MKILVVGGGSGGHITPAVAVVREILERHPRAEVEFWTDFKYYKNVTKLTTEIGVSWGEQQKADNPNHQRGSYIRVRRILAGKFHRYADWHFKDYFIHLDITLKDLIWGNFCGFLGFLGGLFTAFLRLLPPRTRPDAIFLKGGYVSLPIGLVAHLLNIPFVIHESDTVAGLANRLLMKKATKVAFGMPIAPEIQAEHPNYVWTGTPVNPEFQPVSEAKQAKLKQSLGFAPDRPLVVVTGGSQGSENINEVIRQILPDLLKFTSVALVAGRKFYESMVDLKKYENWEHASLESNFRMWEFCTIMDDLMGAADVVVSRAGATTIAELAALQKAAILVPFERLPGAHQVKNAERLQKLDAVAVINDSVMLKHPDQLLEEIRHLVRSPKTRANLAANLHAHSRPDAAAALAEVILEIA